MIDGPLMDEIQEAAAKGRDTLTPAPSQAPLLVLSPMAMDKLLEMIRGAKPGTDPYKEFVQFAFGVPIDQVTTEQRQLIKNQAYAYIYGTRGI